MATAEHVIAQIQSYIKTLPGVRFAPDDPVDSLSTDISSICYLDAGTDTFIDGSPAMRTSLETYAVEILTPRRDLPRDHQRLIPFVDSVPNLLVGKLKLDRWGGTIQSYTPHIEKQFISKLSAGVEYIGYKFLIPGVKRDTAMT